MREGACESAIVVSEVGADEVFVGVGCLKPLRCTQQAGEKNTSCPHERIKSPTEEVRKGRESASVRTERSEMNDSGVDDVVWYVVGIPAAVQNARAEKRATLHQEKQMLDVRQSTELSVSPD